jgi:peroxiredoxin
VKRDPVVLIVVAMVVSLMLVLGFNLARHRQSPGAVAAGKMQGKQAPDFTLQTLEGKTVKLSDYRGKAVLLNFWATWCEPCKLEMPWFVEMQKQYGPQGLQIIGVAMDDADPKDIAKFATDLHVDYPILVGKDAERDAVGTAYGGVQFLPETFFISRDGVVADKIFGLKGRGEIEDSVKKVLAQNQVAATPLAGNKSQ